MWCPRRPPRVFSSAVRMTMRACLAAAAVATLLGAEPTPATAVAGPAPDQDLHNVTYRARVDGVARGAKITYKIDDAGVQTADPTMLLGRTFEANAVLSDPQLASMQVSIQWPYSANLHCEILVDDAVTAQADEFIAPRIAPVRDDPNYGVLSCGAPLDNSSRGNAVNTAPVSPAASS